MSRKSFFGKLKHKITLRNVIDPFKINKRTVTTLQKAGVLDKRGFPAAALRHFGVPVGSPAAPVSSSPAPITADDSSDLAAHSDTSSTLSPLVLLGAALGLFLLLRRR